ncbi:MAG: translational GTPase TypA [Rhodospirillales bacterium]|nr:translational GTPase TypA [Rhodospirillales bacterium]
MDLRNIAIIAHVDHGKTTLVDALLRQSGIFHAKQNVAERAMDSMDQERERGITILSKCTSIEWRGMRINVVDTPGHADFGGEVERILGMVDGVLLLVDAVEGAMPQTKFVTAKALALGLKPIVVVNKVDRPEQRVEEVHEEVFDLFAALGATDEQLDFPVLYASSKEGWASTEPGVVGKDLDCLVERIVEHVASPEVQPDGAFTMLATTLESDPYLGRVLTGRIQSGFVTTNMTVKAMNPESEEVETTRLSKVLVFRGLKRIGVERAEAGDIVALAGFTKATVADTLCDVEITGSIGGVPVDPPTLSMTFSINDSPFAGQDGSKVTSRMIRDRLMREAEGNVAIRVTETADKDAFEVAGRGELQLGVLIETLRREGYELSISRPRVLYRTDPDTGARTEPIEEIQVDVDDEFSGIVVEAVSVRKGELMDMRPSGGGKTRMTFHAPSRGLIGYHGEFMTETRGTGVLNRIYHGYAPYKGAIPGRRSGVLISSSTGSAVPYALNGLEGRGPLFVEPGTKIYEGMIVGEHTRPNDLIVNPLKTKHLTNIRASGKDDAIRLSPARRLRLEPAIAYIGDDELVEVTPKTIRLRKRLLNPHDRKRAERAAEE